MKTPDLFIYTFGYWGWGTHTKELVSAMDKAEANAGYRPPIFADIRFNRAVRAIGFQGDAFKTLVGTKRYYWMKRLGNSNIGTDVSGIKIADPSAAIDLFDLAIDAAKDNRRIIFFCACDITSTCHRHTVAKLLAKEAKKRAAILTTAEWPGGEPQQIELSVPNDLYKKVVQGRKSVPLAKPYGKLLTLPWNTVVKLIDEDEKNSFLILTGPAKYADGPYLPVLNGAPFGYPKWR